MEAASTLSALAGALAVACALASAASAGAARKNEMSLMVAEIPLGAPASSASMDLASMRSRFELGRMRGASGEAWSGASPDGVALVSDVSQHLNSQSLSVGGAAAPDRRCSLSAAPK